MITTVVTVTSTFLAGTFGAAAVAALILFLIMRELTSAHAEESGSMRTKILSHTLLVPISPLLVVFAFIVAVKVLEVLYANRFGLLSASRPRTGRNLLGGAALRFGRRSRAGRPRARFGMRLREPSQGRDEPRIDVLAFQAVKSVEDVQPRSVAAQPRPGCQDGPDRLLDRRP